MTSVLNFNLWLFEFVCDLVLVIWSLARESGCLGCDVDGLPAAAFAFGFPEVADFGVAEGDADERGERLGHHHRHRTALMFAKQARNDSSNPFQSLADRL